MAPTIDRERLFSRVRELCAINAPSRCEQPIFRYLQKFWLERKESGLTWETVAVPDSSEPANIIMRLEGTGEPLMLCAHMDTVPLPPGTVTLVESDGVLRTDGSSILGSDDRAGIALALEMIDLCLEGAQHPPLEIVFTVQEELGCLGSACLYRSLFRSRMAFNLDGETSVGTAITSAPQKGRYAITVHGISSHAALEPQLGRNAIRLASGLLLQLPDGQVDTYSTANTGTIAGGKQTNVVCDLVKITGELRSFSKELFTKHRTYIDTLVSSYRVPSGCSVEISWEDVYAAYAVPDDSAVLQRFKNACMDMGCSPLFLRSAGGGDANNLNSLGIQTIVFGMGMHHIHTTREYVVWEEIVAAAELLVRVVFRIPTDARIVP
jgi:tripeptide aminopeptidase